MTILVVSTTCLCIACSGASDVSCHWSSFPPGPQGHHMASSAFGIVMFPASNAADAHRPPTWLVCFSMLELMLVLHKMFYGLTVLNT